MAPLKKKKKVRRHDDSNGTNGNGQRSTSNGIVIQVIGQNDGNAHAQPWTITKNTTQQGLGEEASSRHRTNAHTIDAHDDAEQETIQTNSEQREILITSQDMSYCAICGGPLAMKTFRQRVHSQSGRPYYEWKAKTQGLKPWLYKKMYLAVSLKHLLADPKFTPEKLSHVGFLQERHEDFNKYEDFRKTGAISSDAADLVCLPSNPDSPDVMDKSRKRKQNSQIHHNGDMQILDVSKERPDYREVQNAGKINGPYGAYPMHEDCCAVANHYIVAANRNGDSLMTMEGVSSWLNLYRDLQGRWSPQQKGVLLAHQYPHGYYGAAEFQGQDWKREEASKVFEASPTDTSYTTPYILSKLRPLPHNVILGTHEGKDAIFLPPHLAEFPWSFIPLRRGNLQWLLLQNTTLDLPAELITFVRDELRGLHNPPLSRSNPTYLPEYWREVLLRGFPWLWDLDHEQCRLKDSETYEDGSKIRWDWERLVRQLAQDDVFILEEGLKNAPDELKNRRRIWRCLDEMRVLSEKTSGEPRMQTPEGSEMDDVDLLEP